MVFLSTFKKILEKYTFIMLQLFPQCLFFSVLNVMSDFLKPSLDEVTNKAKLLHKIIRYTQVSLIQ